MNRYKAALLGFVVVVATILPGAAFAYTPSTATGVGTATLGFTGGNANGEMNYYSGTGGTASGNAMDHNGTPGSTVTWAGFAASSFSGEDFFMLELASGSCTSSTYASCVAGGAVLATGVYYSSNGSVWTAVTPTTPFVPGFQYATSTCTESGTTYTCIYIESTTTPLEAQDAGDVSYELAWIIFWMTIMGVGFIWNSIRKN